MKNSIIVPFDLNTARKIKSGEIEGSVLINNIEIEFVYESKDCAGPYNLLFVRKDEYGISAIYANTEGCALGDTTLELRVEAGAYFKEGDILTSTKGCQFIYDGLITEGAMGSICGMTTYGDIEFDPCTLWTDVYDRDENRNVRELFDEDLEQADRALINKVYHMLFDIGSDFESVIRMLYSFRNGPKSGIKVANPEDNYEWTNKDGNEKYSTKNLPKAHFRWDWRKYTLSKESVDKTTEFVDTILKS